MSLSFILSVLILEAGFVEPGDMGVGESGEATGCNLGESGDGGGRRGIRAGTGTGAGGGFGISRVSR